MLGAKRALVQPRQGMDDKWLCHTSDLQQRSAPEAGEANVQVISERALSSRAAAVGAPMIDGHTGRNWCGLPEQSRMFGLPHADVFTPTHWLFDGDTVTVGHCTLNVRHCPGHTPGHVVFHAPEIGRERKSNPYVAGT